MKSDQELKQKFKVFIDKKGIVNLIFLKVETDPEDIVRLTELIKQAVLEIFNENPQKSYNAFVDILPIGNKISYLSGEIRKTYSQIMSHKQVKSVAITCPGIFYQAVVNLIIQTAGRAGRAKCFPDKKEALKWLRERE